VVGLDPERNAVLVGRREGLDARGLVATDVNWIAREALDEPLEVEARIRHNAPAVPARLAPRGSREVEVRFEVIQRAVTPGQSVVFYRGDVVFGGGVIARAA
jgi:tRNA-specific 2-thiouridylase